MGDGIQQLFMLIEQTAKELYVHRKQCRLTVTYVEKMRKGNVHGAKLKLILDSKTNNIHPIKLTAEVAMEEEQLKTLYRKLASSRLYIHRHTPRLTILEDLSIILKDTTCSFTQKQISTVDEAINHGYKYWRDSEMQGGINIRGSISININISKRNNEGELYIAKIPTTYFDQLLGGQAIFQLQHQLEEGRQLEEDQLEEVHQEDKLKEVYNYWGQLQDWEIKEKIGKIWENIEKIREKNEKIREDIEKIHNIQKQLKGLVEEKSLRIDEDMSFIKSNSPLFPEIPLTNFIPEKSQLLSEKEKLFRHIFVTQLVTHMIINQFGKNKKKHNEYRDGRMNYWYEDEQLQAMRSCGHRFSEFRDFSVETFHPPLEECEQSDTDSEVPQDVEDNKQEKKKKKREVSRLGNQIKRVLKNKYAKKKVENFMVISRDKSSINKKRYCLHQMTRETDKTQALINFVQLTFSAYWPREDLLSKERDSQYWKKKRMKFFLNKFKVKRSVPDCLEEYSRESFFHKVLNIGLRIFKQPHQLTYLRLPFSHLFWSIKALYQRHKKAILKERKEKNEKRMIKVYRGFHLSEAEIEQIKQNIGAFIQMEGFLSTTLSEQIATQFAVTMFMTINVPAKNLKGLHDNGFAHISRFSYHPKEREVLFNAFNMFKIQSLGAKTINNSQVYEMTVEYGGIKQVEDKVGKSQNLLESEFLMKVEEEKIACVKHVLNMKEEKMTPQMVQQLREALTKEEENLKKWKRTLEKQEEREWAAAYEGLSKWEQELLDNCTHLQQTMQHIDNYGQLLQTVIDYDRAIAYGRRMVRQGERDRAIEGWQWVKTPCLLHQLSLHRLLLAQCYHRQSRYLQQGKQLQAVKELYTCMNIPPSHYSYKLLIQQLQNAYTPLKYCGQWEKSAYYKDMVGKEVVNKKELYYDTNNTQDKLTEIFKLSMDELQGRIVEQRDKVKQMSITQGNYTHPSQQQHYILIYMLYQQQKKKYPQQLQKRDYSEVKRESVAYLHNKTHSSHPQTTIQLFTILLNMVDNSKVGRRWLCIVGKHLTLFLSSHLYHTNQIQIVYQYLRKCVQYGEWMTLSSVLLKLAKTQLSSSCTISFREYGMMMEIDSYMWGLSVECMTWVKNTQQQLHSSYQLYRKQQWGEQQQQLVRFPHSIAKWAKRSSFSFEGDGVIFLYQDAIKRFLDIEVLYTDNTSHTQRHIQHLQHYLYYLFQQIFFKGSDNMELGLEVTVWQQPCEVWNRVKGEYGVPTYMGKGELLMVILYLHHHPNYIREIYTTARLHLPRDSSTLLHSLIQSSPAEQRQGWEKMRRRHEHRTTSHSKQAMINKANFMGNRGESKVEAVIIQSYTPTSQASQEWQQLKAPLLLLQDTITEARLYHLLHAKQYCKQAHVLDHRVVGLWDGHQRAVACKQVDTIRQLHGTLPPIKYMEQQQTGGTESLTQLMKQQIRTQIQSGQYLQHQHYLIPTLQALLSQHALPDLFIKVFFNLQKCQQLMRLLLSKQEWRKQVQYQLYHHYPNISLQSQLQQLIQQQYLLQQPQQPQQQPQQKSRQQKEQQSRIKWYVRKYLYYYQYDDINTKCSKEYTRYGVLRALVHTQSLHPSLMQLLSPIIHQHQYNKLDQDENYQQEQQQEYDQQYQQDQQQEQQQDQQQEQEYNMKDALVSACVESKSCVEGWWTRWWE